jgi:hypothetical protein
MYIVECEMERIMSYPIKSKRAGAYRPKHVPWARCRRRGAIAVIVVFALILLMGAAAIAVDYGVLNADVNRLQRGCDAGALAGATKLKSTGDDTVDVANAKALAVDIARRNKVTVNINDIVISDGNRQIYVPARYERSLFFARVFNWRTSVVSRAASARKIGLSTPKISPIGISNTLLAQMKSDYAAGITGAKSYDQALVNLKKDSFDTSKFMLFDLRSQPAKSPEHMMRQLVGTEVETVELGANAGAGVYDTETILNANTSSQYQKYVDGMTEIFNRAAASPWFDTPVNGAIDTAVGAHYANILAGTEPADNPRILNLIVTPDAPSTHGTYEAPVVDFAPVYVERVYSAGGTFHTVFRYLPQQFAAQSSAASLVQ